MLRAFRTGCLAAAVVPVALAAETGPYCVREVPVVSDTPGAVPRGYTTVEGADYPLVGDGGRFWAFAAEGALSGPHDPGLWIDVELAATSPEGRTLLVGGREERRHPGPELVGSEWHTRLMESVAGVPTPLDPAMQRAAEWARGDLFWSDLLGGFVGSSVSEDGRGRGSWMLRDGRIEPLARHGVGIAADLPGLGAVALAGFPGFSLALPDGRTVRVAALRSGETPVWNGIHETRDAG